MSPLMNWLKAYPIRQVVRLLGSIVYLLLNFLISDAFFLLRIKQIELNQKEKR